MGGGRFLISLASLVIVVAGLKAAAPLLVPFTMALFLSILGLPLLTWLRGRLPRWLAVLITVLANIALVVGLVALVSGSVSGFVEAVPRYRVRLEELVGSAIAWLNARGLPASDWVSVDNLNPGSILDLVTGTLKGIAAVLANLFLVVVMMIFILLEVDRLPGRLRTALGASAHRLERYTGAGRLVQRYLAVKTVISMVTGALIGFGVSLIGLDFPLLWGLLAFLFNYIPNLGSIIAAIPAVLLALVQLGPAHGVAVTLLYLAVNIALGNLLEPQLVGRRLGLSPLVVFLSLVFWGWVWGPVGMLLSVPLTLVVRIFLEGSEELGWVAVLLAARPRLEAAEASAAGAAAGGGAEPAGPGPARASRGSGSSPAGSIADPPSPT